MKKIILLLLLSIGSLVLVAQDCNLIRQKIKSAIASRALDEALVQVKALRACDISASGKKEADDWTEKIFLLLQERKTQAKIAEQKAKVNAEQAQRDAERAETARREAEIERNKAVATQAEVALKVQERDLAEEERALALRKKVQLIRVADLRLLGRNQWEQQKYAEAKGYFQEALLALQSEDAHNSATFVQDSTIIVGEIALIEKIKAMELAIQHLYINLDSVIQNGIANFTAAFRALDAALALPVNTGTGLSYAVDSLRFVRELENFEFACVQQANSIKTGAISFRPKHGKKYDQINQHLILVFASTEVNIYLNRTGLMQKRLRYKWVYDYPLDQYSDKTILREYLERSNKHKWTLGAGIRLPVNSSYNLLKEYYVCLDGNEKKEFATANSGGYIIPVSYRLNQKLDIGINTSLMFAYNEKKGGGDIAGRNRSIFSSLSLNLTLISLKKANNMSDLITVRLSTGLMFEYFLLKYSFNFPDVIDKRKITDRFKIARNYETLVQNANEFFESTHEFYLNNSKTTAYATGDFRRVKFDMYKINLNYVFGLKFQIFPFFEKQVSMFLGGDFLQPFKTNKYIEPLSAFLHSDAIPANLQGIYDKALKIKKIEIKEVNIANLNLFFGIALRL